MKLRELVRKMAKKELEKAVAGILRELRDGKAADLVAEGLEKLKKSGLPEDALDRIEAAARKMMEKAGIDVADDYSESGSGENEPAGEPARRSSSACRLASCWNGANASERMMNILSPKMSEETFEKRLAFMLGRGVDSAHVFLLNQGDGEASGFSPYGRGGKGKIDDATVATFRRRIARLKEAGLAVAVWLVSDDSEDWAEEMLANAATYVADVKAAGLLDGVALICLGLEMDEYGTRSGWKRLAAAVREACPGVIVATHYASGEKWPYADLGDAIMGQLPKDCTEKQIAAQIARIKSTGKIAYGFEYSRGPDRAKANAALKAGAAGVGNY